MFTFVLSKGSKYILIQQLQTTWMRLNVFGVVVGRKAQMKVIWVYVFVIRSFHFGGEIFPLSNKCWTRFSFPPQKMFLKLTFLISSAVLREFHFFFQQDCWCWEKKCIRPYIFVLLWLPPALLCLWFYISESLSLSWKSWLCSLFRSPAKAFAAPPAHKC